jgi:hypothetical protein
VLVRFRLLLGAPVGVVHDEHIDVARLRGAAAVRADDGDIERGSTVAAASTISASCSNISARGILSANAST